MTDFKKANTAQRENMIPEMGAAYDTNGAVFDITEWRKSLANLSNIEVNDTGQAHVVMRGKACEENSTDTPLDADGVFLGTGVDILDYSAIAVFCYSDVGSALQGLEVQYSDDLIDWYTAESYTVEAGAEKWFTPPAFGSYMRIKYTNGNAAQSDFHLHVTLRKNPIKWSSHNIEDPITDEDDAELVKAVITGKQTNGDYDNVSLTNQGNMKVAVYEYGDTPSIDAFARLRISEPFTLFDSKQLHDKQPLFWDESVGGSATSTHSSVNAATTMTVTANSNDFAIRQTKQRMNYQPGKLLRNTEPVLTTSGWKPIGDMQVGDEVFDGLGNKTEVVGVYPHTDWQLYRLTFDDGTEIDAGAEHLWKVKIRKGKDKGKFRVVSTQDMIDAHGHVPKFSAYRFCVPASPVLNIEDKEVPIDPYTLGVILGDGHIDSKGYVTIINPEEEIKGTLSFEIGKETKSGGGCPAYGLLGSGIEIRNLGLNGTKADTKFVPKQYLFNSKEKRLAVLRGLMDTDGTVSKRDGTCEYNTASEQLAEDVAFLVRSLGGQAKIRIEKAGYKNDKGEYVPCLPTHRIRVIMQENPFQLKRKAELWKPRTRISYDRFIHSIIPVDKADATCIRVASEDHTFLTKNNIVTHNSQLAFMTFRSPQSTGVTSRIGYFDGTGTNNLTPHNGIFFECDGVPSWNIAKNGAITETVTQSNWNVDKLDGTGPSGITLDLTATQIALIDFEWLGVGRVRVGFVIDGMPHYCHYFNHANDSSFTSVYMSSPNLPLRYSIEASGTNDTGTLDHICSSVISEGGVEQTGVLTSVNTDTTTLTAALAGTTYALLGVRLKAAYSDITVTPEFFSMLNTDSQDYRWSLQLNPTIAGTFTYSDVANSALQRAVGYVNNNTVTSPGLIIDSGYVNATAGFGAGGGGDRKFVTSLRMGSTIAGVQDTLVLCVTPLVAGADMLGSLTVREML